MYKNIAKAILYCPFLSTIFHGILDALTTGGKDERFFFPSQAVKVFPIGISKFFSSWGVEVI